MRNFFRACGRKLELAFTCVNKTTLAFGTSSILFTHIFMAVLSLLNVACRALVLAPFVKSRPYDQLIVLASLVKPGCKSTAKMLLECEGIDLAETRKVPLRFFTLKKKINLKGMSISPKDFLKLVAVAKELRILNLESCVQIHQ